MTIDGDRVAHSEDSSDELDEVELAITADLRFAKEQRVGPLLSQLREQQEQQQLGNKEEYSVEHLRRLYAFAPVRVFQRSSGRKEYCSKVHEKPCQHGCQSCHFCRQRTTEKKTQCSKCAGRNNYYGGPGRGILCGACLSGRFGENIDEVLENPDWVCPCCRDICNCSGVNCMRLKRGWFPTNQLSREAIDQGYKSVAHYLILTHLSEHASVESIGVGLLRARRGAQRAGLGVRRQQGKRKDKRKEFHTRGWDGAGGVQETMMIDFGDLEDSDVDDLGRGIHGAGEDNGSNESNEYDEGVLRQRLRTGNIRSQQSLQFRGTKTRRDALELASKPRLEREITDILRDLRSTNNGASSVSVLDSIVGSAPGLGEQTKFLCLLDEDDCDEEEEDDWDNGDIDAPKARAGASLGTCDGIRAIEGNTMSAIDTISLAPQLNPIGGAPVPVDTSWAAQSFVSHATMANKALYADGGARQVVTTVSVSRGAQTSMRVCERMLPPKRPKNNRRRGDKAKKKRRAIGVGCDSSDRSLQVSDRPRVLGNGGAPGTAPAPAGEHEPAISVMFEAEDTEDQSDIASEDENYEDDVFWLDAGGNDGAGGTEGEEPRRVDDTVSMPKTDIADLYGRGSIPDPADGTLRHVNASISHDEATFIAARTIQANQQQAAGVSLDEFVWNGLCLRATSVVDAVKTFYEFHPDVKNSTPLQNAEADRKLYEDVYESTRPGLQRVLKSAEGLLTEESIVYYQSGSSGNNGMQSTGGANNAEPTGSGNHRISTVGGLRRAVQLFSFLSRILPEEDVTWRIEKRLLGTEPFADFKASSPHAKAVLLRGWLEFVAILEKRRIANDDALICIGNALGSIAIEMKEALPLLDAIMENKPMPTRNVLISGWSYDKAARSKRLVEVFTDLSVLYASLHEVFMVGIQRATEASVYLGPKSHRMLTRPLVKALLDPHGAFPAPVVRRGFTLICTIIDLAFKTFDDESMSMTAEERNVLLRDRNQLLDFIESDVIPDLEVLVHQDYNMWGSPGTRKISNVSMLTSTSSKQGIGSEKVEVLARCYALQVRAGRATWTVIESKATEPYSFLQYWRYANLRYRHFSLYLLAHALERAPVVLWPVPATVAGATVAVAPSGVAGPIDSSGSASPYLPTILRMWLLSVLDFGRHECSWYLTTTISKLTGFVPDAVDFRRDTSGRKAATMLTSFARRIAGNQTLIHGIVASIDDCLQERQREIVQTAFNADRAVLKWHRATSRALLAFLGELQHDMRRERELLKLLRRCVIWSIQDLQTLKGAMESDNGTEGGLDGLGLGVGASNSPAITTALGSVEADLRQALDTFEFDQMVPMLPRELEDEVECHEPSWIFFSGIIGLGGASLSSTPFERVVYDRVAAALFAGGPQSHRGDGIFGASGLQLHRHVLGTHIRRVLTKTNFVSTYNEKLGVSAMRFARAILSRPEMRTPAAFEGAFDMMLTTWISILSQSSPATDSLAVRFELIELLNDSIKLHGGILASSHLHREFWKVVCSECLRMISCRFPDVVLPAALTEAEFIYCHVLPTYPGLEFFVPSTPAVLTAAYNNALSEVGRPPSFGMIDSVAGSRTLVDVLPRVLCTRQLDASLRPGDFAWTLAKAAIGLLAATIDVTHDIARDIAGGFADGEANLTQSSAPGVWYPLCCMPYLEALARTGERMYTLIRKECDAFFERLECKVPGVRAALPPEQERPAREPPRRPTSVPAGTSKTSRRRHAPSRPLSSVLDVESLELNVSFSIAGKLSNVRKLERDGVKVARCVLRDEEDSSRELQILVSKPDKLVASLLDPSGLNAVCNLPRSVLFRGIELVRKTKAVARSTAECSMECPSSQCGGTSVSAGVSACSATTATGRPTPATVFISASKELVRMGYSLELVTRCLQTLQRHASALSKEMIVRRVVSMLNE